MEMHYVQKFPIDFGGGQRSWGSRGSNSENLVNTISRVRKLGCSSYVAWRCVMVTRRTLLFLVEIKGHLGSRRSKAENLVYTISQGRKLG